MGRTANQNVNDSSEFTLTGSKGSEGAVSSKQGSGQQSSGISPADGRKQRDLKGQIGTPSHESCVQVFDLRRVS
jgi:hypothetical protein